MSNIRSFPIQERVVPGRRLGRHVEHDDRSRAFGVVHQLGPLRSVVHHRHCDAFDQGELGSCTGNAMAGALMTGPLYREGRNLTEANAVELYSLATRCDRIPGFYPPDDTGSSGLAVARAAQKMGMVSAYHHAFGLSQALYALSRGPVIIGIDWFAGFDEPVGVGAELRISGEVRGGHEVVLDRLDVENGFVGGTNSWGKGWGAQGRFVLTFGTFRQLLARDGDVVVPVG